MQRSQHAQGKVHSAVEGECDYAVLKRIVNKLITLKQWFLSDAKSKINKTSFMGIYLEYNFY